MRFYFCLATIASISLTLSLSHTHTLSLSLSLSRSHTNNISVRLAGIGHPMAIPLDRDRRSVVRRWDRHRPSMDGQVGHPLRRVVPGGDSLPAAVMAPFASGAVSRANTNNLYVSVENFCHKERERDS